jgi:release factor glutamine methyltransferase
MNDIAAVLAVAACRLEAVSETPRLDAELLMAHALGMNRNAMLLGMREWDVPPDFEALIERRLAHEPVAYIRGYQEFWDLTLAVTPDVLIPRSDSETLIEAARGGNAKRILDLGTGSGALLLAALSLFPDAQGVGIDASARALAVAKANSETAGFAERCTFMHRSWHDAGWSDDLGRFDLILCNPPYVETGAALAPQVRDYEPHAALYAGEEGLNEYRTLIPQMPALLTADGIAIFELGRGQDQPVTKLAAAVGLSAAPHKDLAGIARALLLSP